MNTSMTRQKSFSQTVRAPDLLNVCRDVSAALLACFNPPWGLISPSRHVLVTRSRGTKGLILQVMQLR